MTIQIATDTPETEKPTLLIGNIFAQGTVTASATIPDGPFGNATSDSTFDFWTPSEATATAEVDMGAPVFCDALGIAAHTLGTVGATVEVQRSADGIAWTTVVAVTPTNDSAIVAIWPEVSARYWRLRVISGPASIGVVKLGSRIIIPSGVALGHVSVNHAERIELLSNDSIDGQFLNTRVIRKSGETTLDFGLVSQSFIDEDMADFERLYNEGRTFFYAGSPANLPLDVGYCKRPMGASEMRPFYEGGEFMQLDFEAQIYVG
jgi:hypothetical protein